MINKLNFFLSTDATFKGCKTPKREADYVSYSKYSGEISSRYWCGKDFVIRESNHWSNIKGFDREKVEDGCGNIASCVWRLKSNKKSETKSGKAYFKDFKKL